MKNHQVDRRIILNMKWKEPHKEGALKITIEHASGEQLVLHADAVSLALYREGDGDPDSTALLAGEGSEAALLELDTATAGALFKALRELGVDAERMRKLRNVATQEGIARVLFNGQPGHPGPIL